MVQKSSSPGKPVASERGQTEGYDQDGPAPAGQEEVPEGTPHCDVPSRAEWSKAAGGPPETGGTDHQAVGHPKSPGAPGPREWEPETGSHNQTTGCPSWTDAYDNGFQGEPTRRQPRRHSVGLGAVG